jgi:flagellar motor switch protein FliG
MAQDEAQLRENIKKIAIILTLVGRQTAQEIIKHFQPLLIERIGREMARRKDISRQEAMKVLEDFFRTAAAKNKTVHGGADYVEEVMQGAMDPDRARRFLRQIQDPDQVVPFESLHDVDPEKLLALLSNEHPQTVALVVSSLPRDLAAKIIKRMDETTKNEVVLRLAQLDRNAPELETVREIEERLNEELKKEDEKPAVTKLGGVQTAADILNLLDKQVVRDMLDALEKKDETLAGEIKMKMVRFEDLTKLQDMEIQRVLKEVETNDLAVALIKSEAQITEAVFRNMSQRGAEMLKDDIEDMKNVKADAIRAARFKIAETMRKLDEEGSIMLNKESLNDQPL